jgi:hypothetical protein
MGNGGFFMKTMKILTGLGLLLFGSYLVASHGFSSDDLTRAVEQSRHTENRRLREEQDAEYEHALAMDRSKEDEKQIKALRAMALGGAMQLWSMLGYIAQTPEVQMSLQTWQETTKYETDQAVRQARVAAFRRNKA